MTPAVEKVVQKWRPLVLNHEAAAHLFEFLATAAAAFPRLFEGGQGLYRDLCRAAFLAMDEDDFFSQCHIAGAVDQVLAITAQEDVGRELLRHLRKAGLRVYLDGIEPRVGPQERVSDPLLTLLRSHRTGLRLALVNEWKDGGAA